MAVLVSLTILMLKAGSSESASMAFQIAKNCVVLMTAELSR
ncbi:hypothetical protein EKH55_3912 [Sinorhizobium alkalisoli]|nr:hypothetical protein EKH55_3912 [Sinorhizobium alkalisoli]